MINQELLDRKISRQKKDMAYLFHNYNNTIGEEIVKKLEELEINAKEICLAVSEFKCQKCGTENNLQFHHLIPAEAKEYMDIIRFFSARYYWSNIIVLCKRCHLKYHSIPLPHFTLKEREEMPVLQQETIDKIKRKFLTE